MKNKQYVVALELVCIVVSGTAYSAVNPASQGYVDKRVKELQSQIDAMTIGQKGSTGTTGSAGTQGIPGNTGAAGPAGAQGILGNTGAAGPAGVQGILGNTGAAGPAGVQGILGNTGAVGPAGVQGVLGNTGAAGPAGLQGIQGDTGVTGVQGIQGDTGATGAQGIQGNTGATGVQGIQGDTGATGAQGIQGNTGATGVQGIQGDTGAQGIQGNTGAAGAQGVQGNAGATGAQGIQGNTGAAGAQGIQGNTGATGAQGIQGDTGTTGAQGIQGDTGATGATGSGVAESGTTGQLFVKQPNNDYGTEWINFPGTYTVGQQAMGGIIFYVDSTRQHGLIAASVDNSNGAKWSNDNAMLIGTTGSDGVSGGRNSTTRIMANQNADGSHNFAAKVCTYYRIQADGITACNDPGLEGEACYADWYLPSKFELNQLYLKKELFSGAGAFSSAYYWSTTETSQTTASYQDFSNGSQNSALKSSSYRFRCIRAF